MTDLVPAARTPLLVLGFIALLLGVAGGLARLGFTIPSPATGIAWHGALMASAFFGTLISLERAVAIGRRWTYLAPAITGVGGVVLVSGYTRTGLGLLFAGSALFAVASTSIWWRHKALHTGLLTLGALGLVAANLVLLAGNQEQIAVPCWIAFLALTIGGERLELSRLSPVPSAARHAFAVIGLALFLTALAAPIAFEPCLRASGILLFGFAAWLARYDIAMRTVRTTGLTRYIAVCLLAGYAWLALGGALAVAGAGAGGWGLLWDAALHSILLGFVFSMVFGHAPVILPAVLRVAFPYSPLLYVPLALLHASLALRVAGDLCAVVGLRAIGGAGNALAIAVFILTAAALVLLNRRNLQAAA